MNETLDYARMFARFPFALRRFFQNRMTLEEAQRVVLDRMVHRDENFLSMVESAIYGNTTSPYLALLKTAGCELGDLRRLVQKNGVEETLRQLRGAGVYVQFEEYKGRKPIVRNGLELAVTPRDFDNPLIRHEYRLISGGSTGAAMSIGMDFDVQLRRMPNQMVAMHVQGALDAPSILWVGILPDYGIIQLMNELYRGRIPSAWYSHIGWRDSKSWLRYATATQYMLFWMRLLGFPVKSPRIARVAQAGLIAQELASLKQKYGKAILLAGISRSVRVAQEAEKAGLDLTGVTMRGGGEAATPVKVRAIERSGARFLSNYSMVDVGGTVAGRCVCSNDSSDVHLYTDEFALITFPHRVDQFDITVPAFHLTTLLPNEPKILFNTQMDDYGIVEERACGCGLESYGYTTHLRQIRSYSKLTGEGVTLIGNEILKVLDVLPTRFGGSPLDYQLMEQEDAQGLTRLALVISPRVEIQNEQEVIAYLSNALRDSSSMADAARIIWQQANTLVIKRQEPVWTERGKLMPLHLARNHTINE